MVVQTQQEVKTVRAWPGFGGGLRKDISFTKIPDNAVWDSLNVYFDKDSAIKRNGFSSYLVVADWVRLIDEWYDAVGTQWIIIATKTKVYTYNVATAVLTDRTPVGGLNGITGQGYSGIGFYGKYFLTNNIDVPIYWDGLTAKFTVLNTTGSPVKAVCVTAFADHLMWFNVQDSVLGYQPQEIIWSDNKNGLVYNSGDAAVITLEDTNDTIVGIEFVINYLVIARDKSMYTSFFIGFPFFYQFNRAVERYGLVATMTFKKTEKFVLALAQNNVIGFDGANLSAYIGQNIKDDIISTVPQSIFVSGSFAIFDFGNIKWRLFIYSRADGAPDTEYAFSEPFQNWSKHRYAVPITAVGTLKSSSVYPTWNQETGTWSVAQIRWNDPLFTSLSPAILYGDNTGNIYTAQSIANDNGNAISAYFNTKPSELQMEGWIKELVRLQFLTVKTTAILTIHLYASDDGINFTEAVNSPYTLDLNQSPANFVDVYAVGTWFYLQVVNNNLNEAFEIREIRASFIPLLEMIEH